MSSRWNFGKSFQTAMLRTLIVSFVLAVFLQVFLVPTAVLNPFVSFGVILFIEAGVIGFSEVFFRHRLAKSISRILGVALFLSAFFVLVMQPSEPLGFEWTVIAVFVIEVLGAAAAWAIVRL